jgi:hypothetical protein
VIRTRDLDLGFTQSLDQELGVGVLGLSVWGGGFRDKENELEHQVSRVAKRERDVEIVEIFIALSQDTSR